MDGEIASFPFNAFTMKPQPTIDKDASSNKEASRDLSSRASPTATDPEAADGANLVIEPRPATDEDT